jgi:hypothetical protein
MTARQLISQSKPNNMSLANEFLTSVRKRFREYKALGDKTMNQVSDNEIGQQPNGASNSIAVIVQHLHGNMLSRWTNFLTEDGEKEWRKRDAEFEEASLSKEEVLRLWNEGWEVFLATLDTLNEDDLLKTVTIRKQPLVVVDAINRQLAHYSYHVGQMVYLGRWFRNGDWTSLSIPKGTSAAFNAPAVK